MFRHLMSLSRHGHCDQEQQWRRLPRAVPAFHASRSHFAEFVDDRLGFVTQKIMDIVWQAGEINQTGLNRLEARPARGGVRFGESGICGLNSILAALPTNGPTGKI